MKRIAFVFIAIVLLLAVVSCSTTQASDVEPVVKISDYTAKEYTPDQIYLMLERFVQDCYGDDKTVTISKDKDARTILVSGNELSSNVGPLAQDGWIVVDLKFEAVCFRL